VLGEGGILEMLLLIDKGDLTLKIGFKDFTASANIEAVVVVDDIKGTEEEKVLVIEGMTEVTNEEQTLFPAAECGIIENNGLVAGGSVRDGVVQVFEFVDVDTGITGNVFRPATSDGICVLSGICC
jgi:hypothetical protein